MDCKFINRTWFGYAIDIIIPGAYTRWRTYEFTKCINN